MSTYGFPDGQELTQWLGQPLEEATGLVIGAGSHVAGPFSLANFASVIVAIKPTGGQVTVKVTQGISGGPASLQLVEQVVVAAGATLFEAFVLFGDQVTIEFDGAAAGESIDYAIYPSNTTTNAQVITQATISIQHNDALIAAEPTIDFEDPVGGAWTIVDDGANTRVKVTPPAPQLVKIGEVLLAAPASNITFASIPQTYRHLLLELNGRLNFAAASQSVLAILNSDFGANYSVAAIWGGTGGGSLTAGSTVAGGVILANWMPAATAAAGVAAGAYLKLQNYTRTDFHKSMQGASDNFDGANEIVWQIGARWKNTNAITTLALSPSGGSFVAGTLATLYGLA